MVDALIGRQINKQFAGFGVYTGTVVERTAVHVAEARGACAASAAAEHDACLPGAGCRSLAECGIALCVPSSRVLALSIAWPCGCQQALARADAGVHAGSVSGVCTCGRPWRW